MDFYVPTVWRGRVKVTPFTYDPHLDKWVPAGESDEFPNLITNAGKDQFALAMESTNVDVQINYFALGSDNTAVAVGDTTLGTEEFRKQVTAYTTGVSTGEIVTTGYVAPSEANGFTTEEIGWFTEATATTDSGVLMAHVNYTRAKVASESLQIERTDTFS